MPNRDSVNKQSHLTGEYIPCENCDKPYIISNDNSVFIKECSMTSGQRLAAMLSILLFLSCLTLAADGPLIKARVFFHSKASWVQLKKMYLDEVRAGDNYVDIVTNQAELDELAGLGYRTDIIHADLQAFYRSRLPDKHMGAYKTLDEIYQYLDGIIAAFPGIVSPRISIGQTYEGRDMWAVKISDNPNIDEDEPELLYTACIHAREVITPEVLFYFMDYLTQNYGANPEVTYLVDNRELWFVVMVNPDGYYYNEFTHPEGTGMWRKNRRNNGDDTYGVDLNRNFGLEWGYDDIGSSPNPGDETYRGAGPFSEPEIQNLRDFTISRNLVFSVYYHSYSNLVLWPWSYDEIYSPDHDIFSEIGDSVSAMNGYSPGPGWTLYPVNGDSDDWNYGEQSLKEKIFAITLEVGNDNDEFWPPESRINTLVSENLGPNLFFARIAGDIYSLKAPAVPVLAVDDTVNAVSYQVSWTHLDTLNPAVSFELLELADYQISTDPAADFTGWVNKEFVVTPNRFKSTPTSFYSGKVNNAIRYFRAEDPYLVQPGDVLSFYTFYDIEVDWDYAYVEVSVDGMNYTPIPGNITTNFNPNGNNRGNGITGASGGLWVQGLFSLSAFAGQYITIRFSYDTDQYVTGDGFYVDDIYPHGAFQSRAIFSPVVSTSYVFTDKPEGDYYYRIRARDAQNQLSAYSLLSKTSAIHMYVEGDANGDGIANVADGVYIINYVFKGGPAPEPLTAADANCDGSANVADAVYLINYIFNGGPAPQCP